MQVPSFPTLADDFIKTGEIAADDLDPDLARPVADRRTYSPTAKWHQSFVPKAINAKLGKFEIVDPIFDPIKMIASTWLPEPSVPTADDFQQMHSLASLRAPRFAEIVAQKANLGFEKALLEKFLPTGFTNKYQNTRELVLRIADAAEIVSLINKARFNLARPYQYWQYESVQPLFHPGHPSYPSGHSTRAFIYFEMLNLVFDGKHPKKLIAVLTGAHRVAENREIAGVHFRGDSLAGETLARRIVDCLISKTLKSEDFGDLLAAAKKEW